MSKRAKKTKLQRKRERNKEKKKKKNRVAADQWAEGERTVPNQL